MANHGPNYGLDADLANKRKATYDPNLEADLRRWIEQSLGESLSGSFHDALKSGVVLCKLLNKFRAGTCKFSNAKAAFTMMENIESFLNGCRTIGVPVPDLFMTVDLYEAKNMNQVLQTLASLRRVVSGGKYLGPTPAAPHVVETTPPPPPARSSAPAQPPRNSSPASSSSSAPSGGAKFCPECGTKNTGAKFCPNCGHKL